MKDDRKGGDEEEGGEREEARKMRRAGHKEDMSLNQKLTSPLNVHYIFYIVLSLPTGTTHNRHPPPC